MIKIISSLNNFNTLLKAQLNLKLRKKKHLYSIKKCINFYKYLAVLDVKMPKIF